ncbi:MAG: hypothetical protein JWP63_3284, partial [Candidatus Solibacter sp.]|nr:hypothetical protein [Candidatus Solibacter sp.]
MRLLRLLTLALVGAALSFPAAFTTGNLVVLRFGDGSAALASSGTAAFLDEYTPAGALVQSIALPTSVNGSNKRLVVSGTATTEGQMSLSTDGKCLVVPGYDAAVGTASITTSTSATVNRVIGKINSSGVIDTTTALTDAITGGNPRAATSTNCTDLWIAGSTAGVRYAAAGATTSTSVSTTSTNIRGLNIFGGQLYASTASGTLRIGTVGTGTPTTTGQTYTNLPGFPTATVTPNAFFFADLNAGVAGVDTLYFVDESLGIQKYSLVSGSWTSNGSIAAATARGLTASVSGTTVTLYVTYGTGAKLAKLVDSGGYNTAITGTLTDLATAGTNTQFRGVAFAPQSGLPSLSINDVSQNEGDAGTTAFTFTVSLSAPAGPAGVTFDIATADNTATSPSDYTANSLTSQTILAGNSTYSFTVLVNGDTTLEPNETFFVNITNVTGAGVSDGQGLGTIVNDEPVTTSPTGTGSATPSTVTLGNSTLLKVAVTPGANPTSTGITVTADLSSIGGSAGQTFFDNGTNGDVTAGDNIFSFQATTSGATGPKTLPVSIADGQTRTGTTSISLTVTPSSLPPSGTGLANPNTLQAGSSTLLTVAVTSGTNPASTGLAVTADLTTIGGSATQQFFDDGTHGDLTPGDNTFSFSATVTATPGAKNLPATITDAQARTGSASIALTIQSPPAPRTLKISQVYGGGGNSGTTYKNDFIEIFNQSNSPVDVTGWSIQHASAVVTTAWNVTPLCPTGPCVIQPYRYFLVGEAAGAGGTTDLPPPDVTGTINMGNATGKAALVNNTTAISGDCPTSTSIADLVGYGSNCHEIPIGGGGGAAPSLDNQSAAVRKGNGCVDTDDNAADFIKLGPIPRNSSAPANVCGG